MKMLLERKIAGFTLIELLVVVLIIGILAAIALPQYQKIVAKTRVSTYLPVLKAWAEAEERYFIANGSYPPSSSNAEEIEQYLDIELSKIVENDKSMIVMSLKNNSFYSSVLMKFFGVGHSKIVILSKMLQGSRLYGNLSTEIGCMVMDEETLDICTAICGHQTVGRVFFYDEFGCLIGNGNPQAYPRGSFLSVDPAYK